MFSSQVQPEPLLNDSMSHISLKWSCDNKCFVTVNKTFILCLVFVSYTLNLNVVHTNTRMYMVLSCRCFWHFQNWNRVTHGDKTHNLFVWVCHREVLKFMTPLESHNIISQHIQYLKVAFKKASVFLEPKQARPSYEIAEPIWWQRYVLNLFLITVLYCTTLFSLVVYMFHLCCVVCLCLLFGIFGFLCWVPLRNRLLCIWDLTCNIHEINRCQTKGTNQSWSYLLMVR